MKNQELKRTDMFFDTLQNLIIIHDVIGGNPSIITYEWDIEEALKQITGTLPEEYETVPGEYAKAWSAGAGGWILEEYEEALGVRTEPFEEFISEAAGGKTPRFHIN